MIQNQIKYTFLLPAYKCRFLKEALFSIQAQTFTDFTVIISDDCSPEPLYDVVLPFLSDARFTYRRNNSNIGAEHLVNHWNLLLSMCRSPYLIIAGDDDIYEPGFLEEMDRLIAKYPDIYIYRSRMNLIDSYGYVIRTEQKFSEFENQPDFVNSLFNPSHVHGIGQFVFNSFQLKKAGGFKYFPLAWFSDDTTAIICSNRGVVHSSEVLFHFRISEINISGVKGNSYFDNLKAQSVVLFYKWFRRIRFEKNGDRAKINRRTCRDYCCHMLWGLWGSVPRVQQLTTILTFPVLAKMILVERITH